MCPRQSSVCAPGKGTCTPQALNVCAPGTSTCPPQAQQRVRLRHSNVCVPGTATCAPQAQQRVRPRHVLSTKSPPISRQVRAAFSHLSPDLQRRSTRLITRSTRLNTRVESCTSSVILLTTSTSKYLTNIKNDCEEKKLWKFKGGPPSLRLRQYPCIFDLFEPVHYLRRRSYLSLFLPNLQQPLDQNISRTSSHLITSSGTPNDSQIRSITIFLLITGCR